VRGADHSTSPKERDNVDTFIAEESDERELLVTWHDPMGVDPSQEEGVRAEIFGQKRRERRPVRWT
jgi:hypothetical protein